MSTEQCAAIRPFQPNAKHPRLRSTIGKAVKSETALQAVQIAEDAANAIFYGTDGNGQNYGQATKRFADAQRREGQLTQINDRYHSAMRNSTLKKSAVTGTTLSVPDGGKALKATKTLWDRMWLLVAILLCLLAGFAEVLSLGELISNSGKTSFVGHTLQEKMLAGIALGTGHLILAKLIKLGWDGFRSFDGEDRYKRAYQIAVGVTATLSIVTWGAILATIFGPAVFQGSSGSLSLSTIGGPLGWTSQFVNFLSDLEPIIAIPFVFTQFLGLATGLAYILIAEQININSHKRVIVVDDEKYFLMAQRFEESQEVLREAQSETAYWKGIVESFEHAERDFTRYAGDLAKHTWERARAEAERVLLDTADEWIKEVQRFESAANNSSTPSQYSTIAAE